MEVTRRNVYVAQQILRWASVCLLIAFAWEYWRWGGPFRTLFWDEDFFSPIVRMLGWQWSEWVVSLEVEMWFQRSATGVALVLFLSALVIALVKDLTAKPYWSLSIFLPTLILLLHALVRTKSQFWQLGQFVELTLQWVTPFLYFFTQMKKSSYEKLLLLLKISIAATFIGHALYAIGYYPVPGHFVSMMMSGFGLDNDGALILLKLVGALDIVAALMIFLPRSIVAKMALVYIIAWGFLTAVARLWSHQFFYSVGDLADQWLAQAVLRTVHFLVPLALWYLLYKQALDRGVGK